MHVVVFLQNAWSHVYKTGTWPRAAWLRALARSRSGQRLRVLEAACPEVELWFDNVTTAVGATPRSILLPDPVHVQAVLAEGHRGVVACGVVAGGICLSLPAARPLLLIPHPGYRVLTNALYQEAGQRVAAGLQGVVRLHQRRGSVAWETLE